MAPVVAVLLLLTAAQTGVPQVMKLSNVLVFTYSTAKPAAGGPDTYVFQCDRGSRKGQYLVVRRGDGGPTDSGASAYRLVAPATAGTLPDVNVLGIHYVKVKPDRRDAFERFVADSLHPAIANLRPDLRLLYYRAADGPDVGTYILIFALTTASRDKYWPGGSDSDELRAVFTPIQRFTPELATYLVDGSALTDPKFAAAVYESRDWSDFVLMPSPKG